jgi:hypothetical protein
MLFEKRRSIKENKALDFVEHQRIERTILANYRKWSIHHRYVQ